MVDWPRLPEIFQESVVKVLDYPTRCSLRKCSKPDYALVNRIPIKLENLFVRVQNDYIEVVIDKDKIAYFDSKCSSMEGMNTRFRFNGKRTEFAVFNAASDENNTDFVTRDLMFILRRRNSTIENLELSCEPNTRTTVAVFFDKLLIALRDGHTTINAKSFGTLCIHNQQCLDFVSMLNSNELRKMRISSTNFTREHTRELVQMDQWKNCNTLQSNQANLFDLESCSHANCIRMVLTPTVQLVRDFINSRINSNMSRNDYFHIVFMEKVDLNVMLPQFIDQFFPDETTEKVVYYCQEMRKNPEHILFMIITPWKLFGTVCFSSEFHSSEREQNRAKRLFAKQLTFDPRLLELDEIPDTEMAAELEKTDAIIFDFGFRRSSFRVFPALENLFP